MSIVPQVSSVDHVSTLAGLIEGVAERPRVVEGDGDTDGERADEGEGVTEYCVHGQKRRVPMSAGASQVPTPPPQKATCRVPPHTCAGTSLGF